MLLSFFLQIKLDHIKILLMGALNYGNNPTEVVTLRHFGGALVSVGSLTAAYFGALWVTCVYSCSSHSLKVSQSVSQSVSHSPFPVMENVVK